MGTLFLIKEARIHNGAKTVSSINGAGKTGQLHVKKNELRTLPNTIHNDKLKMDWRPKWRPETVKLLEENTDRTLLDINQSKLLYDPPSRVMEINTKVNKWDLLKAFIKFKNFGTAKETISKMKR